jgi:hypothetical protein
MFNEAHVAITKVLADELEQDWIVERAIIAMPDEHRERATMEWIAATSATLDRLQSQTVQHQLDRQSALQETIQWFRRFGRDHAGGDIVVPEHVPMLFSPQQWREAASDVQRWSGCPVVALDERPVVEPDSLTTVGEHWPGFEVAYRGGKLPWRVLRTDECDSGLVALREVDQAYAGKARAEVTVMLLRERHAELFRQIVELQQQVTPDDAQEKAIRLAESLGDLMHRVRVLGTAEDKWGKS